MDPASQAVAKQSSSGYLADEWFNVTLEPMTKLWQGVGGHSNIFFSEEDARVTRGAYHGTSGHKFAESLWRMAQVEPSMTRGYRDEIQEFVVDIATPAAVSICRANTRLGGGSVFQYYVPDWEHYLMRTSRTYRFATKNYPSL